MVFVLLAGLWILSASVQEQEPQKKNTQTTQAQEKDLYTCEMHPEVKSDKPGKCPTCGIRLTNLTLPDQKAAEEKSQRKATAAENIKEAKRLLSVAKGQLSREGKYNCCIEVPCDQCILEHQSCPCYEDLKNGKPVCNECYGGWQRGEGRDKKIDPKKIKTSISGHRH